MINGFSKPLKLVLKLEPVAEEENSPDTGSELFEYEHGIKVVYKAAIAIGIGVFGTILLAWILGGPLGSIMSDIQDGAVYHLIPFLFSVSVFGVLMYKAAVKNIRGLEFLSSAVLLHGLAELLNVISPPDPSSALFNRSDDFLAWIGDIMLPMAVFLVYLHVELIEKIRPGLLHGVGIIGTAAPLIIGGLIIAFLTPLGRFDDLVAEIQKLVNVYLAIFALVILWISVFGLRVMYRTLKHADSPDVSNGSLLVLIGFASLLTNFLLLGFEYSSSQTSILFSDDFQVHNTWLLTFALIAILTAYITNPEFAYSVPFDVYQLLVINSEQGITLFSFINEFRQKGGTMTHSALKSPAIVAIQNLVREIAYAEGHIILIGMSDRILIMKSRGLIVTVLIAEQNSYFINKGLEDFTKRFYEEFEEHIVNFMGNVSVFHDATKLIRAHLPFMRKESLVAT